MAEIRCRQQCFCTYDFYKVSHIFWVVQIRFLLFPRGATHLRQVPPATIVDPQWRNHFLALPTNFCSCTTIDFWTGLTLLFELFVGAIVEYHIQTWALLSEPVTREFPLSFF